MCARIRSVCTRWLLTAVVLATVANCGGDDTSDNGAGGTQADGGGATGSGGTGGAATDGGGAMAGAGATAGSSGSGGINNDGSAGTSGADSGWKGPPSCASQQAGAGMNCGTAKADCCESLPVAGGSFNRINNANYPATVSSFSLDRFEVTVGRMRAFVAAYPSNKPKAGDGPHPLIPGSGWDSAWDKELPPTQAKLRDFLTCVRLGGAPPEPWRTWTDLPGANENKPVNCVDWYMAFAFCAWDGGRLPTEAEWNYAAAAGDEQREYPWGSGIDSSFASYHCTGDGSGAGDCAFSDILSVGSKPKGDGRWGQADLSGNLWEWILDWHVTWAFAACIDCAVTDPGNSIRRGLRGGGTWDGPLFQKSIRRDSNYPTSVTRTVGFRCAR